MRAPNELDEIVKPPSFTMEETTTILRGLRNDADTESKIKAGSILYREVPSGELDNTKDTPTSQDFLKKSEELREGIIISMQWAGRKRHEMFTSLTDLRGVGDIEELCRIYFECKKDGNQFELRNRVRNWAWSKDRDFTDYWVSHQDYFLAKKFVDHLYDSPESIDVEGLDILTYLENQAIELMSEETDDKTIKIVPDYLDKGSGYALIDTLEAAYRTYQEDHSRGQANAGEVDKKFIELVQDQIKDRFNF